MGLHRGLGSVADALAGEGSAFAGGVLFVVLVVGVLFVEIRLRLRDVGKKTWPSSAPAGSPRSGDEAVVRPLGNFDWRAVEPRRWRPFKPVYHITMALRSDTPSELITIDADYLDRINQRRLILSQHDQTVLGCLPEGVGAVGELYQYLLGDYLPSRYPSLFSLSPDGALFSNRATGASHPLDQPREGDNAEAQLRVLGEMVEEELFLLREEPTGHRAVAFVCCFPSGFDPASKLGKSLAEIHGPVPSYEKIGPSMERFFRRLEVGQNVKRLNWAIQTDGDLFQCPTIPSKGGEKTGNEAKLNMDKINLRVELQTLSRLPQTRAILFSFKTYLYPVRRVKEEGLGEELVEAIRGLKAGNAPGMWEYKGADRWGDALCEYLRS